LGGVFSVARVEPSAIFMIAGALTRQKRAHYTGPLVTLFAGPLRGKARQVGAFISAGAL